MILAHPSDFAYNGSPNEIEIPHIVGKIRWMSQNHRLKMVDHNSESWGRDELNAFYRSEIGTILPIHLEMAKILPIRKNK